MNSKTPTTNEEWLKLFSDFLTFQFGIGQASGMFEAGKINQDWMDGWEESRNKHYGLNRSEMMSLLRERLTHNE
jgi:hypothetical protein